MSDTIRSLIRTGVPIGVGAALAWLVTLGIDLPPEAGDGLIVFGTALLQGIYYTLVRVLEERWPWLGVLVGPGGAPVYVTTREYS